MNTISLPPFQVGVVSVAGVETFTGGIITATMLEDYAIWGMTFGAWVKLALAISVILVILINIPKAIRSWRSLLKEGKE